MFLDLKNCISQQDISHKEFLITLGLHPYHVNVKMINCGHIDNLWWRHTGLPIVSAIIVYEVHFKTSNAFCMYAETERKKISAIAQVHLEVHSHVNEIWKGDTWSWKGQLEKKNEKLESSKCNWKECSRKIDYLIQYCIGVILCIRKFCVGVINSTWYPSEISKNLIPGNTTVHV